MFNRPTTQVDKDFDLRTDFIAFYKPGPPPISESSIGSGFFTKGIEFEIPKN